jgi:hypothetical protein
MLLCATMKWSNDETRVHHAARQRLPFGQQGVWV